MQFKNEPIIPPFRFSIVEKNIYRGAYPTLKNYRFLKRLQLRHIISLIPETPISDLKEFCDHENIINTWIKVKKWDEKVTITHEIVTQLLQILIDNDNIPIYIHCLDGRHITGLIIMCLRKLQNYDHNITFSNHSRYIEETISKIETDFYDSYNGPINLPSSTWLWNGKLYQKHPYIQLITEESKNLSDGSVNSTELLSLNREKSDKSNNNQLPTIDSLYVQRRYPYVDLLMVPKETLDMYLNPQYQSFKQQSQRESRTLENNDDDQINSNDDQINTNDETDTQYSRLLQALSLQGLTMKSMRSMLETVQNRLKQ